MVYLYKPLAFFYAPAVLVVGLIYIFKNKNKNNEVLLVSAYVVGVEVFLRMNNAMYFNEFGKYSVILFMSLGIFFSGISKYSLIYFFLILLLIPSLILGALDLSTDTNIRKAIAFNISGPVTLAVCAIYSINRNVTVEQFKKILLNLLYPLSAMLVYIFLYTPNLREAVMGTDSNFNTSGGFGPNQVSTMLGMGLFVSFSLGLLFFKNKIIRILFFVLVGLFAYRGLLTFSRGGLLTGIIIVLVLLYFIFINSNGIAKAKVLLLGLVVTLMGSIIFTYASTQTGGLLSKRYTGKDALGREKASKFSGREKLADTELDLFMENPVWGVGVGKIKEEREELTGIESATHNEITRMLAEHGILGIVALLILIITPLLFYINHRQNLFFLSFFLFWLLTINHAAMRIAAPAFIYGLTLINLQFNAKENSIHR